MKELICIVCPKGCHIKVADDMTITGFSCERGKEYAYKEVTAPTRVITSTVVLSGGDIPRLPVKTDAAVPKERIFEIVAQINRLHAEAPVKCGDVIEKNICGTEADLVATRTIDKK